MPGQKDMMAIKRPKKTNKHMYPPVRQGSRKGRRCLPYPLLFPLTILLQIGMLTPSAIRQEEWLQCATTDTINQEQVCMTSSLV